MLTNIQKLNDKINMQLAKRELLLSEKETLSNSITLYEEMHENALLAKELILSIAENTQGNIGKHIASLVTGALHAVFDDPYDFVIEFTQRRGNTEADLLFSRDGYSCTPIGSSGGGAIDIASLALRLSLWSINKNRHIFILDEPFRNLSSDLHERAGLMLQELAKKLDIQIIMVSHNPEIIAGANKVFTISNGICNDR